MKLSEGWIKYTMSGKALSAHCKKLLGIKRRFLESDKRLIKRALDMTKPLRMDLKLPGNLGIPYISQRIDETDDEYKKRAMEDKNEV